MTANRAPTNSEVAYSRDVISSSENMILLIQKTVDDLEKRKAELSSLVSKHKAAISPLKYFPPELLVEIFVQFVARYDSIPPLALMGLCSRWRRIILDTPRLWTKILTPHPMIDYWIARSKELPLHLELSLSSTASYSILEALIPHSYRWEYVYFDLESSSYSILARVKTRLHSLKKLELDFGDTTGTVDFCEVAPQLTEINLMSIYESVVIKLPWEQLRVCTLDNTEIAHYVLQHAKNLEVLSLDVAYGPPEPPELMLRGPHSHHLGLDTLIMEWGRFGYEMGVNPFFSSTTLPTLRTLKVCFNCLDSEGPFVNFVDTLNQADLASILAGFFERSCTHLNTLKLTDIPFSQSALIKCLAFSPSLVSLDIQFDKRWHKIDEELLDRLNVNHPRHILPRLRSLSLQGTVGEIEESLDTLITSRRHIDPTHDEVALLEDLTLKCTLPWSESRPPQFHRFVSEGLNITYGKNPTEG